MSVEKLSLQETRDEFVKRMQDFEGRLQKATLTSPGVADIASEFTIFKHMTLKSLQSLQHQVDLLAKEVDLQEMRGRRKILLLHGVSESDREDVNSVVCSVLVDQLKLVEFSTEHISRCHRMGRITTNEKARPLLVKFRDINTRDMIWSNKTKLKGTNVSISEFLTKTRHDTFMAARQRFGVRKCWTRDGFVHVLGSDGVRHRISSMTELGRIAVPGSQQPAPVAAKVDVGVSRTKRAQTSKK
ncbi:uncharacterized protein LOC128201457 [Galleria mellonella]|uniref:Uncharacterized protein LOC128201457 n=1 Tax=Galleria mellonella TaxID=7137 RepID=A0ABM3MTA8_GALME|nr:uncharacterized protein LOC128201457 [Galleria mellonella]